MRFIFLLLPLLYLAEFVSIHGLKLPWSGLMWDVEMLALGAISLPALLQMVYWLVPFQILQDQPARVVLPKFRIRIGRPVPLTVSAFPALANYRLHRVTETEMVLRAGNWWAGSEVVLRNLGSGGAELEWSSLNVVLFDAGASTTASPSSFLRLLASELETFEPAHQIQSTQDFFIFFEASFSVPFPEVLLPAEPIALLPTGGGCLLGTAAVSDPCVLPDQFAGMPENLGAHYWFSGVWGYGANSHAFYYVDIQPHRCIWLRLPFGGAYGDTETKAAFVVGVLSDLAALLTDARYRNADLRIVQNMGDGEIAVSEQGQVVLKQSWCLPDSANALKSLVCHEVIQG